MEFKQEADLEDYDSDEDARYPFILVMCGSAMGFFRVGPHCHKQWQLIVIWVPFTISYHLLPDCMF